jgi:hypothetical protein
VLTTVVHHKSETDKFRNHRASPRPSFDWLFIVGRVRFLDFGEQFLVDKRAFFL